MSVARFSVRNPVLVNLIMILIVALGTFSLLTLPRELFPQVRLNRVVIAVEYAGASPEEVEKLITKPIEDEIKDVDYIDVFISHSSEGRSRFMVVFESINEEKFRRVYQDLRQEVDKVKFPEGAEDPFFLSLESSTWMPMATLAISGDIPEGRLKELAEELQDEIEALGGIDSVNLSGIRKRQIWIEIDPEQLYKHRLTLDEVAQRLRRQNIGLPSGNLALGDQEYLLRSVEEFKSVDDIADVVIREDSVGNHVRLQDIAGLRDTYEEPTSISRFNGKPSVSLNVFKKPEGNTLELIGRFKSLAEEKKKTLPPGVEVAVSGDFSGRIINAIDRLSYSGLYGGLLVLLILLVFLGARNALFVFWGIPITFLLTFAFIDFYGESMNEASLFALVLVLGMIVDDAIVVVENMARYLNRGYPAKEAAVRGTEEVLWPVVSSSLTTIAAFLPLMLLPGAIGEWMKVVPICVSFALMASLFEALVILPSHVADLGQSDPHRRYSPVNRTIRAVARRYRGLMAWTLRRRWAFLPLIFLVIASSFLVIPLVGVDLFEDDEFSLFLVRIWMPEGTRIEATDAVARQFEEAAMTLPGEEVLSVVTQVGRLDTESERLIEKDVGQVLVSLVEPIERRRTIDAILAELEAKTARITGYKKVQFAKMNTGPPVGKPVEVKIKGKYFEDLQAIAARIKDYLATIPGVHTIQDDFEQGKNELRIRVDKSRAHLVGLDATSVARHVKYAFDGIPATLFRDGDEELEVVIKFAPEFRQSIQDITQMKIPSPGGGLVPFTEVADFVVERGWAAISRFDGERAVTVSAEVNDDVMTPVEVSQKLQAHFVDVAQQYPGYRLDFRGEFREFENVFKDVTQLFLVGVILIYLILGTQFRSYVQPILVMFAIPFAFAGAMLCLLVNGYHFSLNVMFGMVALSGVAVNDSIVLISFVNDARARGASVYRAIMTAGKRRLRPIFLTTVTTIFGLLPMSSGIAGRSVVWMPLAGTIVWGLGVSTFLILLVMPPLYATLEDVRGFFWRGRMARRPESVQETPPARIKKVV